MRPTLITLDIRSGSGTVARVMLAIRQFITIARLTALEAIRQPLAFLLFATALFLVGLLPLVLSHTLGESEKFVRDGALAFMWLAGLILGAHLACASLSGEIRRGTVSAVLSKPIGRTTFFLAKYTGIAVVMTLFAAGILMAVLLAARTASEPHFVDRWAAVPLWLSIGLAFVIGGLINFFLRRPFVSNAFATLFILLAAAFLFTGWVDRAGQPTAFGAFYDFRILYAGALIALAILVLAALSVSLATRLRAVPTLSICGAVFLLGLLSDYFFGRFADGSAVAKSLYYLLPNWQHFWVVDALAGDGTIPWVYVSQAGAYALLYLAGLLVFGVTAFQRMEVKA